METQDHKKPKQPGYEGHSGGGHVCGRCGWPYPKSHPSSKHRRAHKKVCGTIEGFKLDNDAQNKNQMINGSDGENASDGEHKAPSGKVVERNLSTRSSSGVGSRSNRSEDDMFSDAVTDFTESPSPGEASDGGIQRFYSMQSVTVNDLDDTKQTAEDASIGEDASVLRTVDEATRDPYSAGEVTNSTAMESTGPESNIENSVVGTIRGPHYAGEVTNSTAMESTDSESNFKSSQKEDGSESIPSLEHPSGVIDPANGSTSKSSDATEDHNSKTGPNEDVYVLAVPDGLPLHKPEIAVEDLDHKGGKINTLEVPDSAMKTASLEYGIVDAAEEASSGIDLTATGEYKKVHSEDDLHESADVMDNKLNQDVGPKTVVEEHTMKEPAQISDIGEASDADINSSRSEVVTDFKTENVEDRKASFFEDEKAITSVESVYPEGACTEVADNQESTSLGAANSSNSVGDNAERVTLQVSDESEVLGKEFSGSSLSAECAISHTAPHVTEISDSKGTDSDRNIGVVQTVLDGIEMKTGGEYNEAMNAESLPCYGSTAAASRDGICGPLEPERNSEHDKLDETVDSGDVAVSHSQPMVGSTGSVLAGAECTSEDDLGAILKSDDKSGSISNTIPSDTLQACEDAPHPLQTSDDVNTTSTEKFPEASGAIESDGSIKHHIALSAGDVVLDSSSQTDSLEGHCGSASVLSAISETMTASDTPASNYSLALAAEENGSLEPKPAIEGRQSKSNSSVEAQVGTEKEGTSEIETLEDQEQKGSALRTAGSSSVARSDNAAHAGKKNEEIIAKVTNWHSDKNHTPLKTLLGEATARSRAESPIHNQIKSQTDEIPVAKNGFFKTENVILSSDNHTFEPSKEEVGKEWNSPARYPVNIKTEKKAKSRPYWAPFFCCSSVNAR